jgi:hypothetical protein
MIRQQPRKTLTRTKYHNNTQITNTILRDE